MTEAKREKKRRENLQRDLDLVAAVPCPRCHARIGVRCHSPGGFQLRPHSERRAAWSDHKRAVD